MSGKKGRKKKSASGGLAGLLKKAVLLLLFSACALVVYFEKADLYTGIRGRLPGQDRTEVVQKSADLPAAGAPVTSAVKAVGIPDYDHTVRFPDSRGDLLTCFRMTGFNNRLLVCTGKSLKKPEEIAEIIAARSFQGRLAPLGEHPMQETIRRSFEKTHRVRFPAGGWVLMEGSPHLPSLGKTLALSACAMLSIFFLIRIIQR